MINLSIVFFIVLGIVVLILAGIIFSFFSMWLHA